MAEETGLNVNNPLLQEKFDRFLYEYNYEKPHQALEMKRPGDIYRLSGRTYRGLPDVDYPFHDQSVIVTRCGRICSKRKKINLSSIVFAGQKVGIREVGD